MTKEGVGHHDLCFLSDPPSQECICERLKQAENYARISVMHTVDVDSYEQGQRDAIAAAVQRIEALLLPWPNTWPGMIRRGDVITAIKWEKFSRDQFDAGYAAALRKESDD